MKYWTEVKDGNLDAFALYTRHYSYKPFKDGRREDPSYRQRGLFVGPGEKIVLLGPDNKALFCWRYGRDGTSKQERRVFCTVFRNETEHKASDMLKEAMELAWAKWPGETLWTYVNPMKIASELPGYCFRRARWKHVGNTAKGLLIFSVAPKTH